MKLAQYELDCPFGVPVQPIIDSQLRRWSSAHAYKQFKQGCQNCETECLPVCLWQNYGSGGSDDEEVDPDRPPHDSSRCQACRLGVCDRMHE